MWKLKKEQKKKVTVLHTKTDLFTEKYMGYGKNVKLFHFKTHILDILSLDIYNFRLIC